MDINHFRESLKAITHILDLDLGALSALSIPDLPEGCDYLAMIPFTDKSIATYGIELVASNRLQAARLALDYFSPAPLAATVTPPVFRPPSLIPDVLEKLQIFPVTFNSFYDAKVGDSQGRYSNKLVWYHEPNPERPECRILCGAYIVNDEARLSPESYTAHPVGGEIVRSERPELLELSTTIYWPLNTRPEDFRKFLMINESEVADEDWPDLITENAQ